MFDIPSTKLKPQLLIFILNQKNISVNEYVFIKCHKGKNYERNHPKRMLCNEYWI